MENIHPYNVPIEKARAIRLIQSLYQDLYCSLEDVSDTLTELEDEINALIGNIPHEEEPEELPAGVKIYR